MRAAEQLVGLTALTQSIYKDIGTAQRKLGQAMQKIRDNLKSAERPEGLLTKEEQEYCGCLVLKKAELEALFAQDEEHWTDVHARVKKQAAKVKGQLQAFFARTMGEMNNLFEGVKAEPKELYALRKLQVFGYEMTEYE